MKQRIVSISVNQTAFTIATMYALVTIIFAVLFVIVDIFRDGIKALVFLLIPILYFVVGYIGVALAAWIYNLIAPRTGGIEFTLTQPVATPYETSGTAGATGFQV